LLLSKRRAAEWSRDEDPNVRALGLVVKRPFAASLLLTVLVSAVLRSQAPQTVISVTWFLMLIPLLRLLPGIFSNEIKPALWLLALLYVADRSVLFFPKGSLAVRWAVMLLAAAAGAGLVWLDRRLRANRSPGGWLTTALVFVRLAIAALAIAFLAEVVGATTLSRFLETGVLRAIYGAVLLYGAMLILQGLMTAVLRSRHVESSPDLMDRFAGGLNFLGLAIFLLLVLRAFRLRDSLTAWLETELGRSISLGAFQFSLGSAAIFVLLIAASFLISKILRFFLSASIYSRLDLQRGSAESVSRLLHYTVLCCGFLLALGAAGIELSKLTVLVGAFGVGLGLGMQNIVGNFVSGIILLFERPLHVGDKITVGATSGEVMDIGIRASTIRTLDGADVIVPNGNLLANEVTNWTLSDKRRRSELRVGVAYGTDPERVIRLLKETTLDHQDILKQPEPVALFVGFGESSLDFVLRYWTLIDRVVDVNSQLHVAVSRRLASEGIEIPFPQRDVNVRPLNPALQDSPPPKPAASNE
jgi:potassium-dependent mechanosensitive channel